MTSASVAPRTAPPASADSAKPARRGLLTERLTVFVAIVLAALSLRLAVTSLTPLLATIGEDLRFGSSVAGVLGMIPTAMFALAGLITPFFVRRLSLHLVTLTAMALATVGLLGRALGGWPLLMTMSAIALIGMGIGNIVVPPLVKRHFPDRVAAMSALYITVLQIGTMLPPLVAVPLAQAAGWRTSLAAWAMLSGLALVPWALIAWREVSARQTGAPTTGVRREPVGAQARTTGRAWRSPVSWGMVGMFGATSLNTYAMFTWLPQIMTDAGRSAAYGGAMVSLFASVGLASGLLAPALAARLRNPFPVVAFSIMCFVLGYAGLWVAPEAAPIVWVVLVGLGPTTFPLALTLINLRTRTAAGSAALSGFTQGLGYVFACLGPLVVGALHSASGGWGVSFGFLYATLVVLAVGGFVASRPRMLEDSW